MAKFEINISASGQASITSVDNSLKSLDSTAKNTQTSLNNTSKSTDTLSSSLKSLGIVIASVGLAELAKTAIKTADTMNLLAGRVALVTKSIDEQSAVQSKLLEIAQKTRQGLEETTGLYTNLATSMQQMGKSQIDILKTTETVNKAITISGSSTSSAAAAITQLGQAFASGTLRGDELNSILENSKGLAQAIADGMGVPIGKLRQLGADGKITSEILAKALEKSAASVDAKFSKMPETVGQALTKVKNLAMTTIGDIDKEMQGSKSLVDVVNGFEAALISSKSTLMELGGVLEDIGGGAIEVFSNINTSIYKTLNYFISLTGEASTKATENFTFFDYFTLGLKTATTGIGMLYDGLIKVINFATMAWAKVTGDSEGVKKAWAVDAILTKEMESRLDNLAKSYTNISNAKKTASSIKMPEFDLSTKGTKSVNAESSKEEEKAEKDRIKKAHDIARSQLKMIQEESDKKIKLEEDYNATIAKLEQKSYEDKLTGLDKEALETFNYYDALIAKYAEVAGAEQTLRDMQSAAMDNFSEKLKMQQKEWDNKAAIKSIDEIYDRYQKLIDAQIELAENGMNIDFDFGDGAKELNNISKAMQQLHVLSLKATKQDMKLQEDFAKNFLEAKGDEAKEKEAMANYDADAAKLKETQLNAEIAGYASLAGAMAGAFEQGSAGAIAFTTLQSALGIASSWTAIANAWALPFPSNIPAVAMVASAVMPIISQLGGSGGSGSGGGVPTISSTGQTYEQNRADIEATYTPITDRLDRQIELLERLNLQGTASYTGIARADVGFERDYKLFIEDTFEKVRKSFDLRVIEKQGFSAQAFVDEMERIDEVINGELFTSQNVAMAQQMSDSAKGFLNEDVLREGSNMLIFLAEASKSIYGQMALVEDIHKDWGANIQKTEMYFNTALNSIFEATAEYANSMLDVTDELKDAAQAMKEAYDNITGSMFYETQRLNQAFSDFDRLRGSLSYADYLQTQIEAIESLNQELDTDLIDLLLSEDPARLQEQIMAIEKLGEVSGRVFKNGAEDALNYLESIELVADAMARSRENIKSFSDSLLTDEELLAKMAAELKVNVATNNSELMALFETLKGGLDGLNDSELELLNANRALIEARAETSNNNIKAFTDSFLNDEQLLANMADELGVNVATTTDELMSLFDNLKGGLDGLNDSELELLNANKALIDILNEERLVKEQDMLLNADIAGLIASMMSVAGLDKKSLDYLGELEKELSVIVDATNKMSYSSLRVAGAFDAALVGVSMFNEAIVDSKYYYSNLVDRLGDNIDNAGTYVYEIFKDLGEDFSKSISRTIGINDERAQNDITRLISSMFASGLSSIYGQDFTGVAAVANAEHIADANITALNAAISLTEKLGSGVAAYGVSAEYSSKALDALRIEFSSLFDVVDGGARAIRNFRMAQISYVSSIASENILFYFDDLHSQVSELDQAAKEAETSLGQVVDAMGVFDGIADTFEYLVSKVNPYLSSSQQKTDRATADLIAKTARIASASVTTREMETVSELILTLDSFYGESAERIKEASMLISETKAYDTKSFRNSFIRLSDALAQGSINADQYNDLFEASLDIYKDVAVDLKAIDEQTKSYQERLAQLVAVDKEAYARTKELEGALSDTNKAILESIYLEEDKQKVLEQATSYTDRLNELLAEDKTAYARAKEMQEALSDTNLAILQAIYAEEDRQSALEEATAAADSFRSSIKSITDTLSGTADSISDVIKKLRGGLNDSGTSIAEFYKAISEAKELSKTGTYTEFSDAVSDAISKSDALMNTENFTSQRDMEFAQLVAANQFEGLQDLTLKEIDYLKIIAENTDDAEVEYGFLNRPLPSVDVNLNSFAVGTPNVPYDMTANIHKGDMFVPASFSDGIRRGDILLGGNGESETSKYIQLLQNEMSGMKQIMMSLLQETAVNNAGVRQMSNGYNAMMVEVI